MSQIHQYFSTRPKISIILPTSKRISFSGGIYVTDKEDEIAFLDEVVKQGNAMIYVKDDQRTITKEQLDPLHAIKQKAKEEAIAEMKAKGAIGMVSSAGVVASGDSNSGKSK